MRQRDELSNPYASTLATEGVDGRSVTFHYLLASAVTAGVVVGGVLAAGGPASADTPGAATAREDTGGRLDDGSGIDDASPENDGAAPQMRLVAAHEQLFGSPADPVDARDADRFVRGVAGSLTQDRAGLERRIGAIRAAAGRPRSSPALHGVPAEAPLQQGGVWARKQLSRAEHAVEELWRPASAGILDFAGSIAATAVQLDAPAAPDLVASPALGHGDVVQVSTGRELLEWGSDWVDRMAEDLVDTIDAMLDRIELRIVGHSVPRHPHPVDGQSPVLSVVGTEPRSGST